MNAAVAPRAVPSGWLQVLTGAATVGALAVAVVAFIGSYQALAGFAVEVGVATTGDARTAGNAWTWPVVIDVTILVATASWIARELRGRPTRYPVRVTFAFVAISVLVNAAHALEPLTGLPRAAAAMSLAALLPIALAVCVHLVVLELHDLLEHAPADTAGHADPETTDSAADTAVPPAAAAVAPTTADTPSPPAPAISPPPETSAGETPDTVDALVTAHLHAGGQLADGTLTAAVASALGVTDRTARRRLQPYRDGHIRPLPHRAA